MNLTKLGLILCITAQRSPEIHFNVFDRNVESYDTGFKEDFHGRRRLVLFHVLEGISLIRTHNE